MPTVAVKRQKLTDDCKIVASLVAAGDRKRWRSLNQTPPAAAEPAASIEGHAHEAMDPADAAQAPPAAAAAGAVPDGGGVGLDDGADELPAPAADAAPPAAAAAGAVLDGVEAEESLEHLLEGRLVEEG